MFKRTIFILFICSMAVMTDDKSSRWVSLAKPEATEVKRTRFDVATFEEMDGRRELLAETTIEGPQGTDFDVKLESKRFQMDAHFLNDLVATNTLRVKADLKTRRAYGQSESNLPLYEEDSQQQAIELDFDEKLVLLPFGRNTKGGDSEQLKIEITPDISNQSVHPDSAGSPEIEIKILKSSPGNLISVEAVKVPHRFILSARLFEDGREVAAGQAPASLSGNPPEIALVPNEQASAEVIDNPVVVNPAVNQYMKRCPSDLVAIGFGVSRVDNQQQGKRDQIISEWAGVGPLGSPMSYDLGDFYLKNTGRKYELRLSVRVAPDETIQ